jgi:hypothetical protein
MNLLRKDMEEQAFFLEIQRLSMEIDKVIEKYDMRDPEEKPQDQYYKDIDDLLDGTGIELED